MKRYISFLMIVGILMSVAVQSQANDVAKVVLVCAKGVANATAAAWVLNYFVKTPSNRWWIPTPFYIGGVLGSFMLYNMNDREETIQTKKNLKDLYRISGLAAVGGIVFSAYKAGSC